MKTWAKRLNFWLDSEGRRASWLAARLGVSQALVSYLRSSERRPTPELAHEVERLSGGIVPAALALRRAA